MKSVLVATSLMAAMAVAKPLEKRYYVTETDVYTVTITETGGWPAGHTGGWGHWGQSADPATAAAWPTGGWGQWGGGNSADPVAAASTTTTTSTTASTTPAWTPDSSWTSEAAAATTPTTEPTPTYTSTSTSAPVAGSWSSAPTGSSSPSAPNSYAQAILDQHNNHRANHSAPALVWDDNMASIAQQIGESCVYAHNT
jgi:hypothetical protein